MSKFGTSAPSASRHHADWLSVVEYSGPFVSLPVMLRVFPQGLEPRDAAQAKALRAAYEDWQDNPTAPGKQRAWVLHVLTAALSYPSNQIAEGQVLPAGLEAGMPEMGETLRPDFALIDPAGSDTAGQAQLLIASYPADQKLDKPVMGKHWKATPATRMMELLHGANVPLGLVTNGERWMLVYAARGEITGYASWYGALWLDEPITLRAFHSLLGVRRFFGVAADSTLLALLKESASDQQEVTDQLGYQVREAVEVLVQSFDAIDKDSNRSLLKGVSPTAQYDAALTIMMRLVFLFSAEERGLLHLGKPLYDNNYAVSTLQEQLQEVADRYGEEVLERRTDAWARLLATFRAVHGGIKHQDLMMQAYGGSLFDPDRYPFLEGRAAGSGWRSTPAEPLAVNNRGVLHLLNSLQRLRIRFGAGGAAETRRVSFRALGVEQIGHVYEGLLDHTGVRAIETVLGIKGTRNKEPEVPLAKLESLLAQRHDKLIDFLKEETGRSLSALRKMLDEGSLLDEHKLRVACGHDEALLVRLRPFAGLVREDSFERPLVVLAGSVYATSGTTRRSTGTHYTPPSLTEPIVQHTLEPLVYEGPADGWPRDQWRLKSPKAILDLKVCDMAMGSGAFLVQVCRYLAERLTEAWENEEKQHPGQVLITPDGKFSEGAPSERLVPTDASERIAIARRVVADRCLYGVDINPMAVEMAKLSLWLITVDASRPFTFLDHAFKCGDSLLGLSSLKQLENFSLEKEGGKQQGFATLDLLRQIEEAKRKRLTLEAMPSDTTEQIAAKAALNAEADEAIEKLNAAADVLIGIELKGLKSRAHKAEREASAADVVSYWNRESKELQTYARSRLNGHRCLHWAIQFPEVFDRGGFSAFVGNPPFVGGSKLETLFGRAWRAYLVNHLAKAITGVRGGADLCTYFLLRAFQMIRSDGFLGFIATNSIAQGDSKEVGLDQLMRNGASIFRATSGMKWPGTANLEVSLLWLTHEKWAGEIILDDGRVDQISSSLSSQAAENEPISLACNSQRAFKGVMILGLGFVIAPAEADALIAKCAKNAEVLSLYINGEDINYRPDQSASRWAINFHDWELESAEKYPDCLSIVRTRVKPERDAMIGRNPMATQRGRKWWRFAGDAKYLYEAIEDLSHVLVLSRVSAYHFVARIESNFVFSDRLTVFAYDDYSHFTILNSTIHDLWAHRPGMTTHETRPTYTPARSFNTFPMPSPSISLEDIGSRLDELRFEQAMARKEGLSDIYRRMHDPNVSDADTNAMRRLTAEADAAVATAYGWSDIELGHEFHMSKNGIRYTITPGARLEILDRLLALNHQRHAEEEAERAVQPISASGKRGRKKSVSDLTRGLFE
jgi:hypothetical protein